jgi:hypothetical protein
MIRVETSKEIDPQLLADLSPIGTAQVTKAQRGLQSILALSTDVRYIVEDDKPLFLVGAFKPTLTQQYKEVWMYSSRHLQARHLRKLRLVWEAWLARQTDAIIARTDCWESERMLRFFGFQFICERNGKAIYGAN